MHSHKRDAQPRTPKSTTKPPELKTASFSGSGVDKCPDCNGPKMKYAKRCKPCARIALRSIPDPLIYSVGGIRCRRIPLTQNKYMLVNDSDFGFLSAFRWDAINGENNTYAHSSIKRNVAPIRAHVLIMNPSDGQFIDHRNHIGLDNRRSNLRISTKSQNGMNKNKKSKTSSKYIGVYYNRQRRNWVAKITINRHTISLGSFRSEKRAATARDAASLKYFKEFAVLNFPKSMPNILPREHPMTIKMIKRLCGIK